MPSWSEIKSLCAVLLCAGISLIASSAQAQFSNSGRLLFEVGGKLPLTRGLTSVSGASGGALTPWAVIGGNELDRGIGAVGSYKHLFLSDATVGSFGAAIGFYDRAEISYAHTHLNTKKAGLSLGLGEDFTFRQHIIGAKVRLMGDAVYDQDRWLPQIAAGVQFKRAKHGDLLSALGASSRDGVDLYVSATKLILKHSLLLNGTLRVTKAHQTGLLGFHDRFSIQPELSAAFLLSRRFAVGGEYRLKPDKLGFASEEDWFDAFATYAITDAVTITLAYSNLGSIAGLGTQDGVYASVQVGF